MGNASVNESEASGDGLLASLYRDRRVLESLTADFTAVYIIDLDTGMAEVMKVGQDTNASVLLGGSATARVDWADVAARYIQSLSLIHISGLRSSANMSAGSRLTSSRGDVYKRQGEKTALQKGRLLSSESWGEKTSL